MVTLATGIDADARILDVSGDVPDSVVPGLTLRVDDERMIFESFARLPVPRQTEPGRNTTRWHVQRSRPVEHDAGATVLLALPASVSGDLEVPPSPFAGTGEQTIRLLGPYIVNFDHADVNNDLIYVADLDAGLLVFDAWFVAPTEWMAGGDNLNDYYIGVEQDGQNLYVSEYSLVSTSTTASPQDTDGTKHRSRIVRTIAGAQLTFEAYSGAGAAPPFTAGVAHIYALIAEPSA